jgi:hypothetical protein
VLEVRLVEIRREDANAVRREPVAEEGGLRRVRRRREAMEVDDVAR